MGTFRMFMQKDSIPSEVDIPNLGVREGEKKRTYVSSKAMNGVTGQIFSSNNCPDVFQGISIGEEEDLGSMCSHPAYLVPITSKPFAMAEKAGWEAKDELRLIAKTLIGQNSIVCVRAATIDDLNKVEPGKIPREAYWLDDTDFSVDSSGIHFYRYYVKNGEIRQVKFFRYYNQILHTEKVNVRAGILAVVVLGTIIKPKKKVEYSFLYTD